MRSAGSFSRVAIVLATAVTVLAASAASAAPPRKNGTDLAGFISGPSQVTVGETISYSGTVRNDGPREANDVVLTFTLTGQDLSLQAVGPGCATTTQSLNQIEVRCLLGTLASRSSATRTVEIVRRSAGEVRAEIKVSASTPDPNADNNTAAMFTQVNAGSTEPEPEPGVGSCTVGFASTGPRAQQTCTFVSTGKPALTVDLVNYLPVWPIPYGQLPQPRMLIADSAVSLSRADNEVQIVACETASPVFTFGAGCANAAANVDSVPENTLLTCSASSVYLNREDHDPYGSPFSATCRG